MSSSLASFVRVSTKNNTDGSFARTNSMSSLSIHRFPSPRQFHAKQLIAVGEANCQPLPIKKLFAHHYGEPGCM